MFEVPFEVLDAENASSFRRWGGEIVADRPGPTVVLDLGRVRYLAAGGVRVLEELDRALADVGATLVLVDVSPLGRRVLEALGLDERWRDHRNRRFPAAPAPGDGMPRALRRPVTPSGARPICQDSTMPADEILLTIPGSAEFLRLARLAAADAGTRVGMTVDEIEDLRIAVDELCHALTEGDPERSVRLTYHLHDTEIEVMGACDESDPRFALSDLAQTIVGAVVDEYQVSHEDGARRFRLRKSALTR